MRAFVAFVLAFAISFAIAGIATALNVASCGVPEDPPPTIC